MNKTELIDAIATHPGVVDKKTAAAVLEAVLSEIQSAVTKGEKVSLTGFGVFEKRARAARMARNPRTGEAVRVKKTSVPAFRPGAGFKDNVAAGKVAGGAAPAKAKKSAAKKSAAKKTTAKKTAPASKATAKKAPASKATAKKAPAKKVVAKKTTAAKKAPAKKTVTAKTTAKKVVAKKAPAKKGPAKKATKR